MTRTASRFLATLNRNVEDWYANRIAYRTFDARQRATWNAIRQTGPVVERAVLRALRHDLPRLGTRDEGGHNFRCLARHGVGARLARK